MMTVVNICGLIGVLGVIVGAAQDNAAAMLAGITVIFLVLFLDRNI